MPLPKPTHSRTSSSDANKAERPRTDLSGAYFATSGVQLSAAVANGEAATASAATTGAALRGSDVLVPTLTNVKDTHRSSCMQKSRRHCSAVNTGQLFLTLQHILFRSDFLKLLSEDASLDLLLSCESHLCRASYKRMFLNDTSVRWDLSEQGKLGRRSRLHFSFVFETKLQQPMFVQPLEIAVVDVTASKALENDANCDDDVVSDSCRKPRLHFNFLSRATETICRPTVRALL